MAEEAKMAPVIRFQGFNDDWEQRKFEDGTSKIGDGLHGTPEYTENGEVAFINGNNLVNGKIVINDQTKFVTSKQQSRTDAELNENTILMSINGTIGNLAWYRGEKLMLGKSAAYIEVKSFHKKFIYQLLQTHKIRNYFLNNLTGTTIKNLGLKTIRETPILIPKVDEQQKIGSFFERLDDAIALHHRNIALLKRLKEAYLKRMLPQNSENIPLLRFADFSDSWEQRKFEDLAESFNYGLNASAMQFDGENKYIRITDIDEYSHRFIQSDLTSPNTDLSNADDYLLKEGDILFARTGASVGKSYQYEPLDGKVYYAGFLIRARIKPEFDSSFIFQNTLTEMYNNFIKMTSQRSGQPGVNAQEYANLSIMVPSKREQVKLGNFFKQLDHAINLHQCKIEKLTEAKKVLLAKMFV